MNHRPCSCSYPSCPGYRAEIYQSGRWTWTIRITHGPTIIGDPMYGMPSAIGRTRAEKKAKRILARLQRDDRRRRNRYDVTPEPQPGGANPRAPSPFASVPHASNEFPGS